MNNYDNQKYFESLCKTYCIAYRTWKKGEREKINTDLWKSRKDSAMADIQEIITKTAESGQTFIVTNAEEVFTLIKYYSNTTCLKYPVINIRAENTIDFPKGKIAKEFYRAYVVADFETICNLSKKMEENIW